MALVLLISSSCAELEVKYRPVPPTPTALLYNTTALATLAGVPMFTKACDPVRSTDCWHNQM